MLGAAALPPAAIAHGDSEHSSQADPSHGSMTNEHEHEHGAIDIPANQPVPTVQLIAHPDAKQGWNLEVQVTNFRFAPEHVNQASTPTEGHAHLYVDGQKITRLYGNWYYLSSLTPGAHEITVSLNANGHETLMYQGEPLQASTRVEVPEPLGR
ncbi:MAG: hypothetical protein HY785_09115 [Oscillatoriophycideae cyanobacterium NC_groundwater_1537_Pr4_S-0.65um_50_18]|nr:hypothetical protein [Oscillatoriophycideae cyanobacterium NC_groundwater_1537_Pr4_S-0.65um_50_18]